MNYNQGELITITGKANGIEFSEILNDFYVGLANQIHEKYLVLKNAGSYQEFAYLAMSNFVNGTVEENPLDISMAHKDLINPNISEASIMVSPNPIKGNIINLNVSKELANTGYDVKIYTIHGQLLWKHHKNNFEQHQIPIMKNVKMFILEVVAENGEMFIEKIIAQ